MDPVCFYIGERPIYWYGVMVAVGFLLGVAQWSILARRAGRPEGFGSETGFWIMVSGILGARLAYVAANLGYFLERPLEIVRIDRGGLIFYGGFLGATIGIILFARLRRQPLLWMGDYAVTALPLGHAIGRVGCFLNGCCYGKATTLPWGVFMADACRHPTQLYESVFNLVLYGVMLRTYLRKKRDGVVLALYLLVYPPGRFLVEFLRGDERQHLGPLSAAQWLSVVLCLAGVALLLAVRRRPAGSNGHTDGTA